MFETPCCKDQADMGREKRKRGKEEKINGGQAESNVRQGGSEPMR
jgi:hypothetical protein